MLHTDDLLEQPSCFLMTLEEYMLDYCGHRRLGGVRMPPPARGFRVHSSTPEAGV